MPTETREFVPVVSRLKYTIRPTTRFDPIRQLENGDTLMQRNLDFPGIAIAITQWFGNIPEDTPEVFEFKSKVFFQREYDLVKDMENPTPDQARGIANLKAVLEENQLWLEDLLELAGIDDLEGAWSQAFSDSLDAFPEWKEPDPTSEDPVERARAAFKGVKRYIVQTRWDAVLPWYGDKYVEVTLGIYRNEDLSDKPTEKQLRFEDGKTRRNREKAIVAQETQLTRLADLLVTIEAVKTLRPELVALKAIASPSAEDLASIKTKTAELNAHYVRFRMLETTVDLEAFKVQVLAEQTQTATTVAASKAASYGDLGALLANPSVSATTKDLTLSAMEILKSKVPAWRDLDMVTVRAMYALPDVS